MTAPHAILRPPANHKPILPSRGTLRALTLWQPWASLLVVPLPQEKRPKTYETRPRNFSHRGPIVIHAAKKEPAWIWEPVQDNIDLRWILQNFLRDPSRPALRPEEIFERLPRGSVVGRVTVESCSPVEDTDPQGFDRILGDFSPRSHAILTSHPHRLVTPLPFRGAQGLWHLPAAVLEGEEWEAAS